MVNTRRFDPYRNFKFLAVIGSALAAVAGFAVVRKLLPGLSAKRRTPKETSSGARPIEGVGTSTVGFVGTTPPPETGRKRPSSPSRRRTGPKRTKSRAE